MMLSLLFQFVLFICILYVIGYSYIVYVIYVTCVNYFTCVHIYTYTQRESMLKKFCIEVHNQESLQTTAIVTIWSSPFIIERRKLKSREKGGNLPSCTAGERLGLKAETADALLRFFFLPRLTVFDRSSIKSDTQSWAKQYSQVFWKCCALIHIIFRSCQEEVFV